MTVDAAAFRDAVLAVAEARSPEKAASLSGIDLCATASTHLVMRAADGVRLHLATVYVSTRSGELSATVDGAALVKFARALKPKQGETVTLRATARAVVANETSLALVDGMFPKTQEIVEKALAGETHTVETAALAAALKPLKPHGSGRERTEPHAHLFASGAGRIVGIVGTNTEYEAYRRAFRAPENATARRVAAFKVEYLQDALRHATRDTLEFSASGDSAGACFTLRNDAAMSLRAVIMPLTVHPDDCPVWELETAPEPAAIAAEPETAGPNVIMVPVWPPRRSVPAAIAAAAVVPDITPIDTHNPAVCGCDVHVAARHAARMATETEREERIAAIVRADIMRAETAPYGASGYPTPADAPDDADRVAELSRVCSACQTVAEPGDVFCSHCGARIVDAGHRDAATAEVSAAMHAAAGLSPEHIDAIADHITRLAPDQCPGFVSIRQKYHGKNPDRILSAIPGATDVRGFHDWVKAGRVVMKGQKGIMIFTPAGGRGDDADGVIDERSRRPRVKKAYVFDISQTEVLTPKGKTERSAEKPVARIQWRATAAETIAATAAASITPFPPATHTPPPAHLPALRADDI